MGGEETDSKTMENTREEGEIRLFGFDISRMGPRNRFIMCVVGVFSCYFVYGIAQEVLFRQWRQAGQPCGWFLTFVQYVFYAVFMYFQRTFIEGGRANKAKPRVAPLSSYLLLAFCSVGTVGLSNASCDYLTYPTQVLFKSSKILPVMLMGTIILRKRYRTIEYVCVCCITLGLVLLNVSNSSRGRGMDTDTTFGFVLILTALLADALIGNFQEKVFVEFNPSASESLFYTKSFGVLISFFVCLCAGQLTCIVYMLTNPQSIVPLFIFCFSGVVGENFVMIMVKTYGALVTVTTTSMRKAVTIMFSFILFPKPVNSSYMLGVFLVLAGMVMNIYVKKGGKDKPTNRNLKKMEAKASLEMV